MVLMKEKAKKKTSTRKMQRDFNNLDKSFENVSAYQASSISAKHRNYVNAVLRARQLKNKGLSDNQIKNDKEINLLLKQAQKHHDDAELNEKQKIAIDKLQTQIIERAKKEGHGVSFSPTRYYYTKGTKVKITKNKNKKR